MDLALTPAQDLLVGTARDVLAKRWPPERAQQLALDPVGFDAELWAELARLGWPGILVPAGWGGSGGTVEDVVLLAEEMGRACLGGPFVPSAVVATGLVLAAGPEARRDDLLPALALGDRIAALALVEESASFDPGAVTLGGAVGGRLSGRKLFVPHAHVAHDLVVATRGDGGINLFVVDARRPGVTVEPMPTMSGDRPCAVTFSGVPLDGGRLLGEPGRGETPLRRALELGALARAAEMVGAARRILDLAVEHARVRVQNGRPIGSYQAVQHAAADMLRDVETARWLVYEAAWRVQAEVAPAAAIALAKAHAGAACLRVARRGHQILGAIGYCEEHPLHLLHKRIHAASLDMGDAGHHLEVVARALGLGGGAPAADGPDRPARLAGPC